MKHFTKRRSRIKFTSYIFLDYILSKLSIVFEQYIFDRYSYRIDIFKPVNHSYSIVLFNYYNHYEAEVAEYAYIPPPPNALSYGPAHTYEYIHTYIRRTKLSSTYILNALKFSAS